jgi:hypothetical protein
MPVHEVDDRTPAQLQAVATEWKAEKTKHAAVLTNKKIAFSGGLGKLLETRRKQYIELQGKTNGARADFAPKLATLKANSLKIKTTAIAYMGKIKNMGNPAEKDLYDALTKIKNEALFDEKLAKVVVAQTGAPGYQNIAPKQEDIAANHNKWKHAKSHYEADLKAHKVKFNEDLGALLDKRAKLWGQYGELTKNLQVNEVDTAKAKTILTNIKANGKVFKKAVDAYLVKIKGLGNPAESALKEILDDYKHDAETDINAYTNAFQ